MPIDNNIILLNGTALRPVPDFTISNEKFTSGDYIIGGFIKVQFNGKIIGSSANDLNSKIATVTSYQASCVSIVISCSGETLIDGDGFIKSVSVTPSDQPFMVGYTMEVEVYRNFGTRAIGPDNAFETLYDFTIPSTIHLSSYEESLTIASTDDLGKTGIFGESFTKPALKISGSINIQAYMAFCSGLSSSEIVDELYTIINNRATKILSLGPTLVSAYPVLASYVSSGWTALHDTKSLIINKLDHKIEWRFDMFIFNGDCHPRAITTIDKTESTDQLTGLSSFTLKGSIKGLSNKSTNSIDHKIESSEKLANAISVYNEIIDGTWIASYYRYNILGCQTAGIAPSSVCYQRSSAQVTQNSNTGEINFLATYADTESCQLGGSQIDISITEERPAANAQTFIVPGRGTAIVQVSNTITPLKIEITANGKLNSCNTDLVANLIDCVRNRFFDEIDNNGYNSYLLEQEEESIGKYSYSITRRYISCG